MEIYSEKLKSSIRMNRNPKRIRIDRYPKYIREIVEYSRLNISDRRLKIVCW